MAELCKGCGEYEYECECPTPYVKLEEKVAELEKEIERLTDRLEQGSPELFQLTEDQAARIAALEAEANLLEARRGRLACALQDAMAVITLAIERDIQDATPEAGDG